ncbi:MAG TPA: WYL domain-containing protein [Anaeromyxobacter sp.]|nr:WYL domain-containing protein [Anaeromyxobacter sp.]
MRGDAFARQWRLLALLEARPGGLEPEEAADHLGVLRRTVYRDLRVLEDAGVPLTSTRDGRRARWRILQGYRHRLQLSLTWSELFALMAARQGLGGLAGTMIHDGAASALDKIRATLPRDLAERFRAADGLVSAPAGGRDYGARSETVRRLIEAMSGRETIAARYRSRSRGRTRPSERRLDPLHLHIAEDGLYLLAQCHHSARVKSFLVDRFDEVRPTGERFTPPGGEPPERQLRAAFRMWGGRPRRVSFVAAPEVADLLLERKVHPSQLTHRRADGSLEVQVEVAIGPPLVAYLTGLGPAVREIEPHDLRDAVETSHRDALTGMQGDVTRRDTRQS